MNKFFNWMLKVKSWKVILTIISIIIGLALMSISVENIGTYRSYAPFMDSNTEFQMSIDLNKALRLSVREDIISRSDLRAFLSERLIEVRIVDDLGPGISGRVVDFDNRIILYLEPNPSINLIRHEAFHIAMIAAGIPKDRHHSVMEENDWCFDSCP